MSVSPGPVPTSNTDQAAEPCWRCGKPVDHSTPLCCDSHRKPLCHRCYKRLHFVEVCGCSKCQPVAVRVEGSGQ